MMHSQKDPVRHNGRILQTFYNIKRPYRHRSNTKTSPSYKTYHPQTQMIPQRPQTSQINRKKDNNIINIHEQAVENEVENVTVRKKISQPSTEQIYNIKKNAYKNYIREIYDKINEELRKKNSYFTLVTSNMKPLSYTEALVTKEVKPIMKTVDDEGSNAAKHKLKERFRLEKLQEESASLEKVKQKLFVIKKHQENKGGIQGVPFQEKRSARTKNNTFHARRQEPKEPEITLKFDLSPKAQVTSPSLIETPQKKKEKVFSIPAAQSCTPKLNIQDFIPAKKIFNKKDPFVCGIRGQKQSTQQKARQKILFYSDFIWKVSYGIGLYVKPTPEEVSYKAFIGSGNNSLMVKAILKRRFWWTIGQKAQGCNFVWTQLKNNTIFKDVQVGSNNKKQNNYLFNTQLFFDQQSEKGISKGTSTMLQQNIFNAIQQSLWKKHLDKNSKTEATMSEKTYLKRAGLLSKKNIALIENPQKLTIHNHLQQNFYIGNKKALFYHMKKYYELSQLNVWDALPLTFHLVKGIQDPEYQQFLSVYAKLEDKKRNKGEERNIWIVKPGENSNRGNGISICHSFDDIMVRLKSKEKSSDGSLRTFILQKYIQKPLLYKNRKFDIRHYLLLTCFNGTIKAYWYPEGYIRTSSAQFNLKKGNPFVHLTNDAIQQKSDQYGKYEKGNKISYEKFQTYLDKQVKSKKQKNIFFSKILAEMKELTKNAVRATYLTLDQKRKQHNFELLGMDFMIDENFKPWLIEINTNPCLQLSSPLLQRLIPAIIENTFKLCVDPFFPPPEEWNTSKKMFLPDNTLEQNKFELIFDENIEGTEIEKLYHGDYKLSNKIGQIQEDAQVYENDGLEQWQEQGSKKNI